MLFFFFLSFFLYLFINSCISMFPLRRDPAQSHRDLSVDGRPWLCHWRRLGVDGRFSFQIHQLERRSVYRQKHPCATKRMDVWKWIPSPGLDFSSQVTRTTITVKTACPSSSITATGTTTTVNTKEGTSARGEVRHVASLNFADER